MVSISRYFGILGSVGLKNNWGKAWGPSAYLRVRSGVPEFICCYLVVSVLTHDRSESEHALAGSSKKVIYAALAGNSLIALTKFIAAFLTGSSAMLSEGIHSGVDTCNQGLLLYGLKQAKKPPDEQFPFGHGKEVYFWCFIVAILIFAVGAGVSIYEGVSHLLHPVEVGNPTVNYIVLGVAMIVEGGAWYFAFREFTKLKGRWGHLEAIQRG